MMEEEMKSETRGQHMVRLVLVNFFVVAAFSMPIGLMIGIGTGTEGVWKLLQFSALFGGMWGIGAVGNELRVQYDIKLPVLLKAVRDRVLDGQKEQMIQMVRMVWVPGRRRTIA